MITPEMELLYTTLQTLAPAGVELSRTKNWIAFQVRSPKGIRNAVTVRREGVSFFTEDQLLLDELKSAGLDWYKILPDVSKSKRRFRFTKLTPENVEKHSEDFRKLFTESVRLKLFYS